MKNKAQVSTVPMVFLVLTICIIALILFYGHAKKISDQTAGLRSPGEIILEKQRAETTLRVLSEEAIAKSYIQTIEDLSTTQAFVINNGASHLSILDTNKPSFDEEYLENFKIHLKENLLDLIEDYPADSSTGVSNFFKKSLENSEISFDGNNIVIKSSPYIIKGYFAGVTSTLETSTQISTSLQELGLKDLGEIRQLKNECTLEFSLKDCLQTLDNFEVVQLDVYLTSSSEAIEVFNLTSRYQYFIGEEKLVQPNIFIKS